jgi:Excalibur calcium-binding domain
VKRYIMAAMAFLSSESLDAHGGGLAADGCHNDRKNGGRHCHRAPSTGSGSARPMGLMGGGRSSGGSRGAFANCTAARAAGAAPVLRGDAGYGAHLDRDGDGVGCE